MPTSGSSIAKPVTGSEKATEVGKELVTGALASLLMGTVGDVVFATTQISSASPPASSLSRASRSAGGDAQAVFSA